MDCQGVDYPRGEGEGEDGTMYGGNTHGPMGHGLNIEAVFFLSLFDQWRVELSYMEGTFNFA